MPNKILVSENRKNIKNKRESDMWHKKPYFIHILYTMLLIILILPFI